MTPYWKRFSVLGLLGLLVSVYLIYHHTAVTRGFQTERSFCSINDLMDCDTVAESAWSAVLGVPVAGWAFAYYLVLIVLTTVRNRVGFSELETARILLAYSFLSIPPSLFLVGVSFFQLNKYCMMCALLDLTNLLLFLVALRSPPLRNSAASFLGELTQGFRDLVSAFFSFSGTGAAAIWISVLFGVGTAAIAPDVLVNHWFSPRRAANYDREMLAPLLEAWHAAKPETVDLKTEGTQADKDFTMGAAGAPVTIVTFSDFECPYCKRTAAYLKPFIEQHPREFRVVFKNYPLDHRCNARIPTPKHEFACEAAAMARCAGNQSDMLFWKMHDHLMDLASFDREILNGLPTRIGVDAVSFEKCMKDGDAWKRVVVDVTQGNDIRVVSTPTVLINGRRVQVAPQLLPGLLTQIAEEIKKR